MSGWPSRALLGGPAVCAAPAGSRQRQEAAPCGFIVDRGTPVQSSVPSIAICRRVPHDGRKVILRATRMAWPLVPAEPGRPAGRPGYPPPWHPQNSRRFRHLTLCVQKYTISIMSSNIRHATLVQQLRQRLQQMGRGSPHSDGEKVNFSSGVAAIDALLPSGILRVGMIVEWITERAGSGAARLALLMALKSLQSGGALVVIDGRKEFYPPAA